MTGEDGRIEVTPWPRVGEAHLATTREEREAIYRLRYDVYTRELSKGFLTTEDHTRGWIKDPEDEQERVSLFYTGTPDAMTGTLRLQVWEPGCVPEVVARRFSLRLFPEIQDQRLSEAARLVIRPDQRGGHLLPTLAAAAVEHAVLAHDVFICFLYCSPGLVHAYMRLGFRPYPGFVIPNEDGIRLPMVMVSADLPHLQTLNSPLFPVAERVLAAREPLPDTAKFLDAVRDLQGHYETDPQRVWLEVSDHLRPGPETRSALLQDLTEEQARALCSCGFVLDVPEHKVVMRQGLVERELYLALTGRYELLMEDLAFAELVATVRSLTPGRAMVLDRNFLERLMPSQPEVACRVLFNLGRIVSGHLTMALRSHVEQRLSSAP